MTLPNTFHFHACPKKSVRVGDRPYKAVVNGSQVDVSWDDGHGEIGCVDYDLSMVEDFIRRSEWSMIDAAYPLPAGQFAFKHADGDDYFGEVDGDEFHVSWVRGNGGLTTYPLKSAEDFFTARTWVLNDFANGFKVGRAPADRVCDRLRVIARGMSYDSNGESEAAGKHLLFELASNLEAGVAHVVKKTTTERVLEAANLAGYDVTFEPAGGVSMRGVGYGSRNARVQSVELALQWFETMAKLKALEAE